MRVKLVLEIPEPSTTKHLEDELWMELVDALRPTHIKPLEIEIENVPTAVSGPLRESERGGASLKVEEGR